MSKSYECRKGNHKGCIKPVCTCSCLHKDRVKK